MIEQIAETVFSDDENAASDFTILTQKNDRITAGDVYLKGQANVTCQHGTVNYDEVWDGMKAYYEQLRANNLLEK